MRSLRITAVYAKRVLVNWLTGWSWSLTLLANQAVAPLIGMAIWTQASAGNVDVVSYYAALLVVGRFTTGYSAHTFSGTIYTGELTDSLLRPHPVLFSQLGWYFGVSVFDVLFIAPVLLALAVLTPAHVAWADVALAVPATLSAAVAAFSFDFALACSAFWTQRYFAATEAGGRLIFLFGGVAAPIPLLPPTVRRWFEVLPFRWMRGYPAEVAAGLVPASDLARGFAVQLAWTAAMVVGATAVYRAGVRRFTAIGA